MLPISSSSSTAMTRAVKLSRKRTQCRRSSSSSLSTAQERNSESAISTFKHDLFYKPSLTFTPSSSDSITEIDSLFSLTSRPHAHCLTNASSVDSPLVKATFLTHMNTATTKAISSSNLLVGTLKLHDFEEKRKNLVGSQAIERCRITASTKEDDDSFNQLTSILHKNEIVAVLKKDSSGRFAFIVPNRCGLDEGENGNEVTLYFGKVEAIVSAIKAAEAQKREAEEQRRDKEERERVLAAISLHHSAATKIKSQFRRMKFVRLFFQTKTEFVAARTIQSVTRRLLARRIVALLQKKQQHMKSPDTEHPLLMEVEHYVDDTSSIPQQSGKSCSCGQDSCVECCIGEHFIINSFSFSNIFSSFFSFFLTHIPLYFFFCIL
jgi:hypothetical protein